MLINQNNMEIEDLKKESISLKSWLLTDKQICDLELILNGAFSPLEGFMSQSDYQSVLTKMRLKSGALWPIPITLDVSDEFVDKIDIGEKITLRNSEGFPIAVMTITDIWQPNLEDEASKIYKTKDKTHPALHHLYNISHKNYVGGKVQGISLPPHYDYKEIRHTPDSLKKEFKKKGWQKIIAFQTRNPIHRAHYEMTLRSIEEYQAKLLIHPVCGLTKIGDVDYHTRVRCYKHILEKYNSQNAMLSLLPLAMRMAGPKEALLHAIIRKNYGCTHLIVGRDHAGPGNDIKGNPFYGPYDAQNLLLKFENEIGIKMVPFKFMVYVPRLKSYKLINEISNNTDFRTISGTELRNFLDQGKGIPDWFSFPNVIKELEKARPPLKKRGFTVFFTGLSGSGKSTLANGLLIKLLQEGSRPVTLLDGDVVRTNLSSELGFSKSHRSINVQRIGYVASEITKNGGVAICAPIAPYEKDRKINRDLISSIGGYFEVYVETPLEKCEQRDVKGLYALARAGKVKEFTGISDPYEPPLNAEATIDSSTLPPEQLVEVIYEKLRKAGYFA